ncbi:MAG TPA: hypothetical protein VN962_15370 [Polyangia bacterium]|nr:hypothetical protein [Polyangia bacterium]
MAEPYLKEGKWYSAYKDRHGRWRYGVLKAVTTKADARRQNAELQLREDRIRKGIEPAPLENADETFGDLLNWWIERRLRRTRAYHQCAGTVRKHIISSRLALLPPSQVTTAKVDDFLSEKEDELSASSVNHLRAYIRAAVNAAIDAERFYGRNPITRAVKKRREPKRKPQYLKPEWVPRSSTTSPIAGGACSRPASTRAYAKARSSGSRRPTSTSTPGCSTSAARTARISRRAGTRTASRSPKSFARTCATRSTRRRASGCSRVPTAASTPRTSCS